MAQSTAKASISDRAVTPAASQRILLAEDDEDLRDLIFTILVDAGFQVETCHNGKEALARLRSFPIDLVLLDLRMPVMDGWEFRTAQRADPAIANVPVVVMTSDRSAQATAIHADAYVKKPFLPHELLSQIERVFLERSRQEQAARLEETERLALLGTVAAGVGHEINNPLAFALGNLELLDEALPGLRTELSALSDASGEPSHAQAIEHMVERLDHAIGLLRDSRTGMERVRLIVRNLRSLSPRSGDRRQRVDLRELVESSISIAWNQIKYRSTLVRSYADVPQVFGNEGRLCQVFLNLLVNAAQSVSPEQTSSNQISVSTRREEAFCVVEVRDTGRGMSKVLQARIFEPFFTTKGTEGGTGLGLSICREIVEAHGGRIEVESELGSGSVFRVYLPLQSSGEQRVPAELGVARARSLAHQQRAESSPRPRVWVLDDEPMVAKIIGKILAESCKVWVANGAREVFLRLEAGETFDAFFCDLMMPDMTGMEVAERLSSGWPELLPRVIFITGGPSTPEGVDFVSQSGRLILDKPFDTDQLRSMLDAVLKSK
jgi:signal transduction histidine kinase